MYVQFETLKLQTITKIEQIRNEELIFTVEGGRKYRMYHAQDCCESVYIEDIEGNLDDLLNSPLLIAEEVTSNEPLGNENDLDSDSSFTWTFYRLATAKGFVTIRWFGTSNGYYSESVDFEEV